MSRTRPGKSLFAVILLVSAALYAAPPNTPTLVEDRAQHQARLASVSARTSGLHQIAGAGHIDELLTELQDIAADAGMDNAVREHLLEAAVIALSQFQPDARSRELVAELRFRPVTVYVRMVEEHGDAVVPLYDVAAAARFTEKAWNIRESSDQVQAMILNGHWTPANFSTPPPGVLEEHWRSGTLQAVRQLPLGVVSAQTHALLSALPNEPLLDSLVFEAAARTKDPMLYGALLQHARDNTLLQAIRTSTANLDQTDAQAFLRQSITRPATASAAILELGQLANTDYATREWLLQQLGDPGHGASAALALARLNDLTVLEDVRDLIAGDQPELAQLRAVLVLRLSELPSAAAIRQQLLASETLDRSVRDALR